MTVKRRRLGTTELSIAPLVLGGNVFGWTADRQASFSVLDAFLERGFDAVDTADVYNRFAPGLHGGESETILGEWMKARGTREDMVLITKGGLEMGPGMSGLGRQYLMSACEASLRRLQTDYIDVYMSHRADPGVPVAETLEAFEALRRQGKIRYAGCSNYTAGQLQEAMDATLGGARYEVVEPHYNLLERLQYEGAVEAICNKQRLGVIAYYALAGGFLTGKYRSESSVATSARARTLSTYTTPRGFEVLNALDTVAMRRQATPAQVALAWLLTRPSVTAPIASATTVRQLADIAGAVELTLTAEDLETLERHKS